MITGSGLTDVSNSAVTAVEWTRPSTRSVLLSRLDARTTDIPAASRAVGVTWTMRDVLAFIADVLVGAEIDVAARARLQATGRERVDAWFDATPGTDALLEVTAAAFRAGAELQTFEGAVDRLATLHAGRLLNDPAEASGGHAAAPVLGQRRAALARHPLLEVRTAESPANDRVIVFRDSSYQSLVLESLWGRYDASFWELVRDWLRDDLLASGVVAGEVAVALSLLARPNVPFQRVNLPRPDSTMSTIS